MGLAAERHETTFSNTLHSLTQCQTPKNWRRIWVQNSRTTTICRRLCGEKKLNWSEKQKFRWKSIYDFLISFLFFFISLLEGVSNSRFFSAPALDFVCIYHDYSCTLISVLDNESETTCEKKRWQNAKGNQHTHTNTLCHMIAIKWKLFLFLCLKQTIWYRLTANAKLFWQTHINRGAWRNEKYGFFDSEWYIVMHIDF